MMKIQGNCFQLFDSTINNFRFFHNGEDKEKLVVNLDVSAVFVLISNLTHLGGCEKKLVTFELGENLFVQASKSFVNIASSGRA